MTEIKAKLIGDTGEVKGEVDLPLDIFGVAPGRGFSMK